MDEIKWYEQMSYKDAKEIIREKLNNMSRTFIATGYFLRQIRDTEGYKEDGYKDIWEFAEDQYGIKRTTTSRWMAMNEKFSEGGNSPTLAAAFDGFGKSQLQEMLYLTDEQMEQVSPEMTKLEIRDLRKPKEEPLSVLGFPKRTYPEGSLIASEGCGKSYTCLSCHREGCEIRGEACVCVESSCGNPFPCTTMNVVENLKEDMGNVCQFVNKELAHHRAGDGEPVPCCKNCEQPCGYACRRSVDHRTKKDVGNTSVHKESVEQTKETISEKKLDESSSCPPGQSSCTRQNWGASAEDQHEGAKECAACWNRWKKTQAVLEKAETEQEEQIPGQMEVGDFPEILPEKEVKNENVESSEDLGNPKSNSDLECAPAHVENDVVAEAEYKEVSEEKIEELSDKTDIQLLYDMHDEEIGILEMMKECYTDNDVRVRKQCVLVAALTSLLHELMDAPVEIDQPEFPKLRNMEEREEFVLNYRTWPVWTKNELTEEVYYRYNLPDESAIVVREYKYTSPWRKNEVGYGKELFLLLPGTKNFKDGESNMTELKEHLKNVQKGERNGQTK